MLLQSLSAGSPARGVDGRKSRGRITLRFSFIASRIRKAVHESVAICLLIGVDSGLPGAVPVPVQMLCASILSRQLAIRVFFCRLPAASFVSFFELSLCAAVRWTLTAAMLGRRPRRPHCPGSNSCMVGPAETHHTGLFGLGRRDMPCSPFS